MSRADVNGDVWSLSEFRGQNAQILHLNLTESEARRLRCLGIFEGQSIELQKAGSPMILSAAGGRVAISQEIARRIVVQASDHQAA